MQIGQESTLDGEFRLVHPRALGHKPRKEPVNRSDGQLRPDEDGIRMFIQVEDIFTSIEKSSRHQSRPKRKPGAMPFVFPQNTSDHRRDAEGKLSLNSGLVSRLGGQGFQFLILVPSFQMRAHEISTEHGQDRISGRSARNRHSGMPRTPRGKPPAATESTQTCLTDPARIRLRSEHQCRE